MQTDDDQHHQHQGTVEDMPDAPAPPTAAAEAPSSTPPCAGAGGAAADAPLVVFSQLPFELQIPAAEPAVQQAQAPAGAAAAASTGQQTTTKKAGGRRGRKGKRGYDAPAEKKSAYRCACFVGLVSGGR